MRRITGGRHRLVVLGATLLLAAPSTVTADVPVSHGGAMGAHFLADSHEYPGVTCRYDDDMNLARVRVRPPVVFARDRTGSRDRQTVGWRVELQYQPPKGGSWSTVQRSTVAKATAWDDMAAPFRQRALRITHPKGSGSWRVVSRMLWYKPGTSTVQQGIARHRYTFYDYPLAEPGTVTFCPAGIL